MSEERFLGGFENNKDNKKKRNPLSTDRGLGAPGEIWEQHEKNIREQQEEEKKKSKEQKNKKKK